MRLTTLLVSSAVLFGCVGTRVIEVDPADEADMRLLVEAAQAQNGEIVAAEDVIRFNKGGLFVEQDSLRVMTGDRESETVLAVPLRDSFAEVRFRYKGSPLGALAGVVVGSAAGYAIGYSRGESSGFCCTRKENAAFGAAVFGIVGAVLGAFVGPKRTTVYRFRPDDASVVSGTSEH